MVIGEGNIDAYRDKWTNSGLAPSSTPLAVKISSTVLTLYYMITLDKPLDKLV